MAARAALAEEQPHRRSRPWREGSANSDSETRCSTPQRVGAVHWPAHSVGRPPSFIVLPVSLTARQRALGVAPCVRYQRPDKPNSPTERRCSGLRARTLPLRRGHAPGPGMLGGSIPTETPHCSRRSFLGTRPGGRGARRAFVNWPVGGAPNPSEVQ